MPQLSRIMIRAALVNCWLGMGLAALLLSYKGVPDRLPPEVWRWLPAHINLLLVGWMVQLSMGVGYWIMPRLRLTERGRLRFAISAGVLLNGGVWLHVLAMILSLGHEWQAAGLILETCAIASFAYHIYPRIKAAQVIAAEG